MTTDSNSGSSDRPADFLPPYSHSNDNWQSEDFQKMLEILEENREHTRQVRQAQARRGERIDDLLDALSKVKDLQEENQNLRYEKEKLEEKIKEYERSAPLPAYLVLIAGVLVSGFGATVSQDIVYLVGGLGMAAVGLTAFYESKVLGKRQK